MAQALITRRSGNGSNLKVAAYASAADLPSTANQYGTGIITSTAIGAVTADITAPSSPVAGDLWIKTGITARTPIKISKSPFVWIYTSSAYQYSGTAWVAVSAYTYSGSAWVTWYTWLYNRGIETVPVHGAVAITLVSNTYISKQASYFDAGGVIVSGGDNKGCIWDPLDMTDYTTLYLRVSTGSVAVTVTCGTASLVIPKNTADGLFSLNISNVSFSQRIVMYLNTASNVVFRVFEAYLE